MNKQLNSLSETEPSSLRWVSSHTLGRVLAKGTALIWRWGHDRQTVVAFVGRYSAHIAIIVLAVIVGTVGRVAFTPISFADGPESLSQFAAAEPVATPTVATALNVVPIQRQISSESRRAVFRYAAPYTMIPDRPRLGVITYTVQYGDNIFTIADNFELSPYTIAWANMEPLQGVPWLIQPGMTLYILPTDGAYHTVMEGETAASIAESYEVQASALYNSWNNIEPSQPLVAGTMLVVPNGVGEDVEWEPPPPPPARPGVAAASASWGACGDVGVQGPGATGWFILPTGSTSVSGWYFHDARNPSHIGLDYRCHLGDPIYAADNGVVVFAGWGGGYGNLVRVEHGNGYQTYYGHFDSIAVGCGQSIYQGQILGYCGTTGWSTGPHLHYEIRLNGVPQNPQLFE